MLIAKIFLYLGKIGDLVKLLCRLMNNRSSFAKIKLLLSNAEKLNIMNYSQDEITKLLSNLEILACKQGQLEAIKSGCPVNVDNEPIPWYTYPSMEYLQQIDFSEKSIYAWGLRNSGLFWAVRAREVLCVENDKEWYQKVRHTKYPNMKVYFGEAMEDYVYKIAEYDRAFDVIIIDGSYRYNCAVLALDHLATNGMIVLDNADRYPTTTKLLREAGLIQMDFCGFGPARDYTWCTSLFIKPEFNYPRLVKKVEPVGGNTTIATDDKDQLSTYQVESYSQEGEDLILREIFQGKQQGFYVDVGAHHPLRFSNTYYLYNRGWSGINIEPSREAKLCFDLLRPRDINLDIGISDTAQDLSFFVFDEPALNTFNVDRAENLQKSTNYTLIETRKVRVDSLTNILNHFATDKKVDFMSVDVEGNEMNVLSSNDWTRYRPKMLLVEMLDCDLSDIENLTVHKYLTDIGYRVYAKTVRTVFYRDKSNE